MTPHTGSPPPHGDGDATDCLNTIRTMAAAGDADAQNILDYLDCLMNFMACRFLKRGPGGAVTGVKKIPPGIQSKLDEDGCSTGGDPDRLHLPISGFNSRVIEDDDWTEPEWGDG